MGEEITNVGTDTTQVADTANEGNTVEDQQTQADEQEQSSNPVENSNEGNEDLQNQESEITNQQQQQEEEKKPTVEELQEKLNEYQVREEEDRMIREQLGLQDIDQRTYDFMNIDQQIINEGKQVYLKLCNEYGIDANPNNIDKSVEELAKTDPAKAYEFQRKFDGLSAEVTQRRQALQHQNAVYEVNKFEADYNQILSASPAISNIMQQYVQNYGANTPNMYGQLKNVIDIIMPAYQEAFNAGRKYALEDKAKKDTSAVSGGVATANTNTYQGTQSFTRDQIKHMSPEDFAKYENVIKQQMLEGKIQ